MAQLTFAGVEIKYILDSIKIKKDKNYNIDTFLGSSSSNKVQYVNTESRVLTFNNVVSSYTLLNTYRELNDKYTKKSATLTGSTDLQINGMYFLTGYDEEKKLNGSYHITWEFTEYIKPNVVRSTFKRFGVKPSQTNTKKVVTKPKSNPKYIVELLTSCKTMKKGSKGTCVKNLQKFLQKNGYYLKYKVDGKYEIYTYNAVKSLQKKFKIKKCKQGTWDSITKSYFRTKYKIK